MMIDVRRLKKNYLRLSLPCFPSFTFPPFPAPAIPLSCVWRRKQVRRDATDKWFKGDSNKRIYDSPASLAHVSLLSLFYLISYFLFQVEEAIDGWFKRCSTGEDGSGLGRSSGIRMGRSRPVIPPLLELHLIQLGNKVRRSEW